MSILNFSPRKQYLQLHVRVRIFSVRPRVDQRPIATLNSRAQGQTQGSRAKVDRRPIAGLNSRGGPRQKGFTTTLKPLVTTTAAAPINRPRFENFPEIVAEGQVEDDSGNTLEVIEVTTKDPRDR